MGIANTFTKMYSDVFRMRLEGEIQLFLNVFLSGFSSIVEGILNCITHRAGLQGHATTPRGPSKIKDFAPEAHPSIPNTPPRHARVPRTTTQAFANAFEVPPQNPKALQKIKGCAPIGTLTVMIYRNTWGGLSGGLSGRFAGGV